VVGGVAQPAAGKEYTALAIDSATGRGSASGDVAFGATFGAMGKTLGAAVGLPQANVDTNVLSGAVIKSALAV
jgi:hypothetical protein